MDDDKHSDQPKQDPALGLIRQKIASLYQSEPSAKAEMAETEAATKRSKHQEFMHKLSTSGKSLAEIQTAWHNYYIGLPDDEKHQVWQEFYAANARTGLYAADGPKPPAADPPKTHVVWENQPEPHKPAKHRTVRELKSDLIRRPAAHRKPSHREHLKSLFFGMSVGAVVVLLLLFSFFNERFIAPFITPSRSVSSTPIIIDPNTTAVGPEPKIIIPKINVELPIVFDTKAIDEASIQRSLEEGVLHYPTTSKPGELGNGAIFGHSSNNILNKGKYKFAFVLLNRLESGDTFMVQYGGKRYIYKVYEKRVVKPSDVGVLGDTPKPATFALITCDPPGTTINRLVVWGEQISPEPSGNIASSAKKDSAALKTLPSNAPSLWQRIVDWFSS